MPERHRVVVTGEAEMSSGAIFARVLFAHELGDVREIGIQNHGAVQFHFDR